MCLTDSKRSKDREEREKKRSIIRSTTISRTIYAVNRDGSRASCVPRNYDSETNLIRLLIIRVARRVLYVISTIRETTKIFHR